MSASPCPWAARSRLAAAAPQQHQKARALPQSSASPNHHRRGRSSNEARAASPSSSAPKLTNKPAWAGEGDAAAMQIRDQKGAEQGTKKEENLFQFATEATSLKKKRGSSPPIILSFSTPPHPYLQPHPLSLRRRPPVPLRQRPHLHQAPLRRHEGGRARRP